jgi:hypothetical protein
MHGDEITVGAGFSPAQARRKFAPLDAMEPSMEAELTPSRPPHPPIADAMGPSPSRKGRGAKWEVSVIANRLHSTCISSPSGAMLWAGAQAAAGSA